MVAEGTLRILSRREAGSEAKLFRVSGCLRVCGVPSIASASEFGGRRRRSPGPDRF